MTMSIYLILWIICLGSIQSSVNYTGLAIFGDPLCGSNPQELVYLKQDTCNFSPLNIFSSRLTCLSDQVIQVRTFNNSNCEGLPYSTHLLFPRDCTRINSSVIGDFGYVNVGCDLPLPEYTKPKQFPEKIDWLYGELYYPPHNCSYPDADAIIFYQQGTCAVNSAFNVSTGSAVYHCSDGLLFTEYFQDRHCGSLLAKANVSLRQCVDSNHEQYIFYCPQTSSWWTQKHILAISVGSATFCCITFIALILCTVFAFRRKNVRKYEPIPDLDLESDIAIIPFSKLNLTKRIGSGSFGDVYLATFKGSQVAVKKQFSDSPNVLEETVKELEVQFNIPRHPNVVQLIGFCVSPLSLVLEYCSNGSLKDFIKVQVDPDLELQWLKDICLGMIHLHSNRVIHRDLACRNILLDEYMSAKISDFGLSRKLETLEGTTLNHVGPVKWMAPESILKNVYSEKSDVWSFGILTIELITKKDPYPHHTTQQFLIDWKKLTKSNLTALVPQLSPTMKMVVDRCTRYDPEERPSFALVSDLLRQHFSDKNSIYEAEVLSPSSATTFPFFQGGQTPEKEMEIYSSNSHEYQKTPDLQEASIYHKTPSLVHDQDLDEDNSSAFTGYK